MTRLGNCSDKTCHFRTKMATQRIARSINPNTGIHPIRTIGKDMDEDRSDRKAPKDKTSLVIFIGLLLDLLGKKTQTISL